MTQQRYYSAIIDAIPPNLSNMNINNHIHTQLTAQALDTELTRTKLLKTLFLTSAAQKLNSQGQKGYICHIFAAVTSHHLTCTNTD
jgi:hypothetical protein